MRNSIRLSGVYPSVASTEVVMQSNLMDPDQRVAELAAFLDPEAFQHGGELAFRKRRRAARREAANRIARAQDT
jgi:hypothetical protein